MSAAKDTPSSTPASMDYSSKELMDMEHTFAAHNYHPIPIVISKASGVVVWDPEGKKYFDFLSSYSAVNQGHCHPRLVQAMVEQAKVSTLTSRAFFNDKFPQFAKYITELFQYDMVLPMNTGAEGVETAMKLARKWGYVKKNIPENEAIIVCCLECFHGRTIAAVSLSSDPDSFGGFGPFVPNIKKVPFNDIAALQKLFEEKGEKIAGFIVEPIQGEAGVIVPDDGYLSQVKDLCQKHNVLYIADEIQTGLARTGRLLAGDWDNVRPDVLILGKALGGGMLPVSAVLASKEIMLTIGTGQHGSTFGGNPLASAVAMESLKVIQEEKLAEKADKLGEKLRKELKALNLPYVREVRGRGLLNAVDIDPNSGVSAWDLCIALKDNGLLAKPTHNHIIRFAPPLVITEDELDQCLDIIKRVFNAAVVQQ